MKTGFLDWCQPLVAIWPGKRLVLVWILLLPAACSTSGLVPDNVNLSLVDVEVHQIYQANESVRFSHQLAEEIRYEFSRTIDNAYKQNRDVRLSMQVQELAFGGMEFVGTWPDDSKMTGIGILVDNASGETIGKFPVRVVSRDGKNNSNFVVFEAGDNEYQRSKLVALIARRAVENVYGKLRARRIAENPPKYIRRAYAEQVSKPIQISVLPQSLYGPMQTHEATGENKPKIIEAPKLLMQ